MSVHVYPVSEERQHDLEGTDCQCEPRVEWINEETGLPYDEGPLVVHERLDPLRLQRAEEAVEREFERQFWGDDDLDPESKALRAWEEP